MEVQQLQGVQGAGLFQGVDYIQHLAGGQAKLGFFTAGVLPVTFTNGCQPGPHTNQRGHIEFFGFVQDQRQFGLLLYHNEYPVPQLLADQRQADVFPVFVAVADNHRTTLAR